MMREAEKDGPSWVRRGSDGPMTPNHPAQPSPSGQWGEGRDERQRGKEFGEYWNERRR